MSEQIGKKSYRTPQLIDFGQGSIGEDRVMKWATEQGVPSDKVEVVLTILRREASASLDRQISAPFPTGSPPDR